MLDRYCCSGEFPGEFAICSFAEGIGELGR